MPRVSMEITSSDEESSFPLLRHELKVSLEEARRKGETQRKLEMQMQMQAMTVRPLPQPSRGELEITRYDCSSNNW